MAGVWRVVHRPRVAVREEPRTSAGIARAVRFGQVLRPVEARGPWIRVLDDGAEGVPSGWVLSDGSSVGLGALLEASSLRPDAVIATAGAQAGRAERPGPSEVLSPGARLGGAQEVARRRLESGDGTWDDVKAAVAGGWQSDAAEALLRALAQGSRGASGLLVSWSFAPDLHGMAREGAGAPTALLFGWGGASLGQLEPPRLWWRQRGFSTLATTGCPRQLGAQVREVIRFIDHDGPVVIHAFSNTGLYTLQAFCQLWRGRIDGVVVDSATGVFSNLRQVFNGCIRSLCHLHSVTISAEANEALVGIQQAHPLQEGDALEFADPDGLSGLGPAVTQPDGEVAGWLVHDKGEPSCVDRGAVEAAMGVAVDGPLSMQQVVKLKAFQVAPTSYPDFTELFRNHGMPALFLYSRHDSLCKAKAIKDYIDTFTKEGQVTSVCFERSGHVEHFAQHKKRYTEELGRFVDALRLT